MDRTGVIFKVIVDVQPSTIDEPTAFAPRIAHLRSYLGACTGAFREDDTAHGADKLVHIQAPDGHSGLGIELTPWTVAESFLANLTH